MDWRSVLGLAAPQAASTARPIGQDELGNWVYEDATGSRYSVGQQPVQMTEAQRNDFALMGLGLLRPDPQMPNPSGMLNALADMVTSGFTAPANALRGDMVTLGDVWDTAGTATLGASAMPAPENALRANSFRAYHGSPHDFDRFSLDKIGTGEGAQAYGHGLYFADSEDVARSYRDALRFPRMDSIATPRDAVIDDLNYHRGNVDGVRNSYQSMIASGNPDAVKMGSEKLALLDSVVADNPGRMYEVNINADPADFLDWDKPLSEQSQKVQDVLRSFGAKPEDVGAGAYSRAGLRKFAVMGPDGRFGPGAATREESLAMVGGDATKVREILDPSAPNRSAGLLQEGIPGIRYLDAGSRGAGDGSRNYVVFDDKLIEIIRKYGWAAAAPIFAQYGMTPEEAQAQYEGQM